MYILEVFELELTLKDKRLNIYLMYLIVFLQGFVFYGPVSTIYRLERGISMYQIFYIESIFWILMITLEIPWGFFADRFGYKKTLLISNVLFFISKIVFFKAYSLWMFILERLLLAIAISGLSGCDMAFLFESSEGSSSQKVFGNYAALATGGYLLAAVLSTGMVRVSLDRTAYYTIFPYLMAALATVFLKETKNLTPEKVMLKNSFKSIFHNKKLILLVIAVAFIKESAHAASVFLNQLQYTRSGIGIEMFGWIAVGVQVVSLSSAKSYALSDRLGKNKSIGFLILGVSLACFGLIFTADKIVSIILIMLIAGSMSLIEPIYVEIQNREIFTKDRATLLSIYAMIGNVIAAIINPVIGKAADFSVQMAFVICVILSGLGFLFFNLYINKVAFISVKKK